MRKKLAWWLLKQLKIKEILCDQNWCYSVAFVLSAEAGSISWSVCWYHATFRGDRPFPARRIVGRVCKGKSNVSTLIWRAMIETFFFKAPFCEYACFLSGVPMDCRIITSSHPKGQKSWKYFLPHLRRRVVIITESASKLLWAAQHSGCWRHFKLTPSAKSKSP